MNKNLVLDVNESPSKLKDWFLFAIQHVLAMLVACITVPLITGLPIGPTLIAAGVGTLIYIFTTKKKSPVFLSSSFAYLVPMSTALTFGVVTEGTRNYLAVILGMIMVGIVYVVIALIIRKVGTNWLNKLLPPVVIGPIIMVIGLSLAGSAINNVMGGTAGISSYPSAEVPWQYTLVSIIVALFACVLTAICATSKKKGVTLIPFVIGMIGAYLFAVVLTVIGNIAHLDFLKVINFEVFNRDWSNISSWITTDFMFINAIKNNAEFNLVTVGQVALLFIPVALVTVCEHIGDHKNLGNIINKDLLNEEPGLTRTLIGDGVATAVSGVICGAANTTYGENVAVIGVSKNASVSVIVVAAFFSIALGFFAPLTLLLQTVPACITGGVSLILYGFIASSGVKMIVKENVDFNITKNIIVASVILVTGIGGLVLGFGGTSAGYIVSISGTAVAMILGIVINLTIKDHSSETE